MRDNVLKHQKIRPKGGGDVRRLVICAAVLALIFASTTALGKYLAGYGEFGGMRTLLLFIVVLPVAFMVSVILLYGFDKAVKFCAESAPERYCAALVKKKYFFKITWAVIFVAWFPGFFASYPGVYVIDNVFQIQWYLKDMVSAHHPILHTYLLGICVSLGNSFFNSYEAGLAIYSLLQMAVLSGLFAYTIKCLSGKLPAILQIVCALLYAILPFHAVSSFTATKDILYSGLFLLLVLKTYEIVINQDRFFQSKRRMAGYILLVFASCCFRNTGIYIFICSIPVFLIICKRYRAKVLLLGLSSLILWGAFTGPVYRLLGVTKGSSAEIMSVPMQQMAYALLEEGEKISSDNAAAIQEYIPHYELYAARVADPVKDTFNADLLDKEPGRFLKVWLETGVSCPKSYIAAFLELNIGFWYPQMQYPDPGTYLAFIPYQNADVIQVGDVFEDAVYLERTSYIPELSKFYKNHLEDGTYQNIPALSMLYSPGFYFWLLCFGILLCIFKRNYRMAVPFSLMFLLWLTLMVSPVVVFRYAYPLIVCFPVMLAMQADNPDCGAEKVERY